MKPASNKLASIVTANGTKTHVLVPKSQFESLVRASRATGRKSNKGGPSAETIQEAVRALKDPKTKWHDANKVVHDIIANGVARARQERGLTQKQLGELLGVAQAQVSRYEKNPDGLTLRVLKRIAAALESPAQARLSR